MSAVECFNLQKGKPAPVVSTAGASTAIVYLNWFPPSEVDTISEVTEVMLASKFASMNSDSELFKLV